LENIIINIIFVVKIFQSEIMETLWTILVGVVLTVALFLFYCKGWWPSTWFRGFLFIALTCLFTPIITFPIQYVIWMIFRGGWGDGDPGESIADGGD
jgi:hypothetical protein